MLERLLVFLRQPQAELDEVRARDRDRLLRRLGRRLKTRIVRQRRIAAHAVVVLHAALGRQPVVVPSHRIEHFAAAHPLKARDDVGVRVGEDVADVQRPADGRRRRVDREDLVARLACDRTCRCRPRPTAAAISSRAPRAQASRERAAVTVCIHCGQWYRKNDTRSGLGTRDWGLRGCYDPVLIRSISSCTRRSAVCDTMSVTVSRTTWSLMR